MEIDLGEKGDRLLVFLAEMAIGFFISRCQFLEITQHPAEILR
ncbi:MULTISPECIES: hypothetical protein [unclassified Microcoleus]